MKWILGVTTVAFVFGILAGVRFGQSAAIETQVQTWLAIFTGCNLLFCSWVWYRAEPGSGDRMVLPSVVLGSAAMLVMTLPRLLWPDAERVHIAASVVSLGVMAVALIRQIRRRRRLRKGTL